MRKLILPLLASIFLVSESNASHLVAGHIYWECVGNNSIVLKVNLYRECAGSPANLPSSLNINTTIPGLANVTATSYNTAEVAEACAGNNQINCNSASGGSGAIELKQYESQAITIPSGTPSGGFKFSYMSCCLPGNVNNIQAPSSKAINLETTLYPGFNHKCGGETEPLVHDIFLTYGKSVSLQVSKTNPEDSLHYRLTSLINAPFDSNYSATNPIPHPGIHPSNGPVHLQPTTGLLTYDINQVPGATVTQGYLLGLQVETWNQGALVARNHRIHALYYSPGASANNAPDAIIDTTASDVVWQNDRYLVVVNPGDSLKLDIVANDFDQHNVGGAMVPQIVKFNATGSALDTAWGGTLNFQHKPVLTPAPSQSGFASTTNNHVKFAWGIASEHLTGAGPQSYFFNFRLSDDHCPVVGKTNLSLEVVVRSAVNITDDSLFVCENDAVTLNGFTQSSHYHWSPGNNLSDSTVASPVLNAHSAGYIYLYDPQNPGKRDSIYIAVEPRAHFSLDTNAGQLILSDSVNNGQQVWYYNDIPFSHHSDTLAPFATGDYRAYNYTNRCEYYTDTFFMQESMVLSLSNPNQGSLAGHIGLSGRSWGVSFQLDSSAAGDLRAVYLPALASVSGKRGGNGIKLILEDNAGSTLFTLDTVWNGLADGLLAIPMNQNLQANHEYKLSLTLDTGLAWYYYENLQPPFSPWNEGLTVTALHEASGSQPPTTASDKLVPLSMLFNTGIGLPEAEKLPWISVYPNPAGSYFEIDNLPKNCRVELYDLRGQRLGQWENQEETKSLRIPRQEWPSGIYLLHISNNSSRFWKIRFE